MLLVTQGRGRVNQLGYNKKTGEYVYLHKGQEIWREKGDTGLLDYFNEVRANYGCTDDSVLAQYPIYTKYSNSCQEFERKENAWLYA
jgi:hypothetical protein